MSPGKPFTGYREGDPIITEEDEYFTVPQVITWCLWAFDSSWLVWNSLHHFSYGFASNFSNLMLGNGGVYLSQKPLNQVNKNPKTKSQSYY